jgi:hypothetical protein
VQAIKGVVPGHSLGDISIGELRTSVIANKKQPKNYDLKYGLVEDEWTNVVANGNDDSDYSALDVWYKQGKVVQIEFRDLPAYGKKGMNLPSLNTLIANNSNLKKTCYSESDIDAAGRETGGGFIFFCYDDTKKGVAYGIGANGDVYLDDQPDTVIVHEQDMPFISRCGLTKVRNVIGSGAVIYRNEADEEKADAEQVSYQKHHMKRNRRR